MLFCTYPLLFWQFRSKLLWITTCTTTPTKINITIIVIINAISVIPFSLLIYLSPISSIFLHTKTRDEFTHLLRVCSIKHTVICLLYFLYYFFLFAQFLFCRVIVCVCVYSPNGFSYFVHHLFLLCFAFFYILY